MQRDLTRDDARETDQRCEVERSSRAPPRRRRAGSLRTSADRGCDLGRLRDLALVAIGPASWRLHPAPFDHGDDGARGARRRGARRFIDHIARSIQLPQVIASIAVTAAAIDAERLRPVRRAFRVRDSDRPTRLPLAPSDATSSQLAKRLMVAAHDRRRRPGEHPTTSARPRSRRAARPRGRPDGGGGSHAWQCRTGLASPELPPRGHADQASRLAGASLARAAARRPGARRRRFDENCRMADERAGLTERGHLKVFIGMAPGVGKTYRMLQEGAAEAESGRDVVIGYLEPHGRAETVAQAEGLEVVPRRRVLYRGHAARGDGPAGGACPQPRAVPDRRARAHQRSRGRAREALRGRARRDRGRASTCSRRSTSSTWRASTTR